ncbi:MAG: archease [Sandaracinaceae bacterium]|nr:archease [Sandaracinaceae bacterium]
MSSAGVPEIAPPLEPRGEHFAHGADIGIRGRGPTMDDAFEQAAYALTAIAVDPRAVRTTDEVRIGCEAPDPEILFFDWINAIVAEMSARRMLFGRFEVRIDDTHLEGRAWGERADPARHAPAIEVKGATFTELRVSPDREHGGWYAQCVVDV